MIFITVQGLPEYYSIMHMLKVVKSTSESSSDVDFTTLEEKFTTHKKLYLYL